ncbi:BREX-2 system phosphatase PglZ [Tsukamurella soli]|uniref:BREX-2 system phosphatase PglZ n=1 Tax=Tsukamurella soli TaxID=644556 RepID=A0ABP8J1X4_9ACTN
MTGTADLPDADLVGITSLVRRARDSKHRRGTLAVAAQPVWTGEPEVTVDGQSVRIAVASSVLGMREALLDRHRYDWVVVLTDRTADELPTGVKDHLSSGMVYHLDAWPALREAFKANGQEYGLLSNKHDAARSALRSLPAQVPPAPGGVLTSDHLFGVLAREHFDLAPDSVTPHRIAAWSTQLAATTRFTRWSAEADPVLRQQFYEWLERRLGDAGRVLTALWQKVGPADTVPLGLVAALTDDSAKAAQAFPDPASTAVAVRARLEDRIGLVPAQAEIEVWSSAATLAVGNGDKPGTLRRAGELTAELRATPLLGRSDVLDEALPLRIGRFATALREAVDGGPLAAASDAWEAVRAHAAAKADEFDAPQDVRVGRSALRLLRWSRTDFAEPRGVGDWLHRYRTELAWVDAAIDEAFVGAENAELQTSARRILADVRGRRAQLDAEFASVIAASGVHQPSDGGYLPIEDVLDRVVAPLTARPPAPSYAPAKEQDRSPVLLLVLDGMGAAAAAEILADLARRSPQWQECAVEDLTAALAVLPTVTRFSRTSLLSGELAVGDQRTERDGFAAWLARNHLPAQHTPLFHKAQLDALSGEGSVAPEVRAAIDDTTRTPVVACVLNTIDDALDKSDPGGTVWTVGQVRHLEALLGAAGTVGRTVVLVSDHGHVVERSEAPSAQRGERISARYRPAEMDAEVGEVLVEGPRVLADGGRAVLAVDEQLRYTGKKAGYHGGATLAEATVPIAVLVKGAVPVHLPLEPRPTTPPAFWTGSVAEAGDPVPIPAPSAPTKPARRRPSAGEVGLFDLPAQPAATERDRVTALLESDLLRSQVRTFAHRWPLDAVGEVVREAVLGNGVLPLARADELLGSRGRVGRTASILQQVFNMDGVEVISVHGSEVRLEPAVLFEQFGVPR